MGNPAAVAAFEPAESSAAATSLQRLFVQRALGTRVMTQAKRGDTYSGKAELITQQGRRWHALDARPVA